MDEKSNEVEKKLARGMTVDRMQSLGDNVFGFAMTLLILNLAVPTNLPSEHVDTLFLELWPQFLTFFMGFMVLGTLWVGSHNLFYWVRHFDRKSVWINMLFLSFIVLIPFSTAILRSYYTTSIAIIAYGINLIICGLALYWYWSHVTANRQLLTDKVNGGIISVMKFRILVPIGLAVLITLFSFISPLASLFMFAGLFILATVPTNSDHIISILVRVLHRNIQ